MVWVGNQEDDLEDSDDLITITNTAGQYFLTTLLFNIKWSEQIDPKLYKMALMSITHFLIYYNLRS